MIKILINNEEVVCNNNISIKEEMLSTSSTILKNCYPKSWEEDKNYTSRYYFPQDYSKCKIIGGQQTRTGTDFSFRNANYYFDYKLLGETGGTTGLQNINVCGKNLFDKTAITSSKIISPNTGNTSTNNDYGASDYIPVKANVSYYQANTNTYYGAFYNKNKEYVSAVQNQRVITPSVDGYVRISFLLTNIDSVQLEQGSTATSYEPYTGNTYEVNLGKNLFDKSNAIVGQNWNGDNLIYSIASDYIEVEEGKSYIISVSNMSEYVSTTVVKFDSNKQVILPAITTNPFTIPVGTKYIKLSIRSAKSHTWAQEELDNAKYQLEKGTQATSYSPYFTPIELNEGDYIYKDETWKTYINGTSTDITRDELITELNAVQLRQGLNNISSTAPLEITTGQLIFCGCVKNTGNISLNPREPHFVDLQVLDFKTLLSEGETLNYVITGKTIVEAINQVVSSISDYGFVVGNIEILNPDDIINAYSTLNKTAYDVFQYIADITQSRWTTRMVDENTIAIDFYDPTLMPTASPIQSTQTYYENNQIIDISFNYSTNDYRNKQIMTSDEVFANITQTETLIADGYTQNFMCQNKLGTIETITVNGVSKTFATKSEQALGITADFYYQPGEIQFSSANTISTGSVIIITYYAIVKGREIILNTDETSRIETQINRKGSISRYENRNDTTSSQELQKIGQSYIKYKGQAEINLKVKTRMDLFNVGQIVEYQAPLEELSTEYMVKSKEIDWYAAPDETFYIYELTSNFNYENAVNYFDNQRAKSQGNIGEGETISRNIDIENKALIIFYDTEQEEIEPINPSSLDFALDGVLI